jgi:hypothetical protein
MAQVFTIEPNPHWVIIDNFSKLPNGAAIYTYRSLNPSQFKPAFQDAAGTIPYGQPIVGFGNGTMPPIFWELDDAAPEETYYIEVWSAPQDQQGVLLWTYDGMSGGGSGGGGTIITNNDIENLIINGQFFRNAGDQVGAPSIATAITIAPSSNAGILGYANNVNDGPPSPDIIFAKNNQTDSDNLTFVNVSPIGTNNLGLNPTPQFYAKYNCTVGGTGLAYKYIQLPLVKGLQNLSGATVSTQMYARLVSGSTTGVTLSLRQFFGNGGSPSADVVTPIGGGPISLVPNTWTKIIINSQLIPSISGKTLGSCGNDALFFQINFPLSDPINVDFILPAMYLGTQTSNFDFHTLDQVDAIVNSPRTGDVKITLDTFKLGYVRMDDGTIGNASSNGTTRANIDTFPLFDKIWNAMFTSQSFAPMFTSAGAPSAYGATSVADFTANRQLSLTKNLGRVMAGALPEVSSQAFTRAANTLVVTSTGGFYTGMAVQVSGGGLPAPLVAGTVYYAIVLSSTTLSLATTINNAFAGTAIVLTTAGTGTVASVFGQETLGTYFGEELHPLTITEITAHTHTYSQTVAGGTFLQGGPGGQETVGNTGSTGGAGSSSTAGIGAAVVPHNTMQPSVFMNVFMKL